MKTYILLLFALTCGLTSNAQAPKTINSLKELTDSIQVIVRKRNIPGLMIGIATKDAVVFSGGFGYADLRNQRKVNGQTRFRMGSITKSFVAIAIQQLVEQGKLNLNDKLRTLAPEVPFKNDWEETNPIRIVNLLEHTSGFDDFKFNKMYDLDEKAYNSAEMMLMQQKSMVCRWRPSERYAYGNVNYVILGYIIRKLTGKEYDQYLQENILLPLGMSNSGFDNWSRYPDQNVREYSSSSGKLEEVPSVTLLPGAAGSLWSCPDDMIRFLQFFLRNGQPLLKEESLQRIEKPVSSLGAVAGLKSGYALGNQDFGRLRGHDGTLGTCKSSYRYNRELGYGFVLASNGNGLGNISDLINDYMSRKELLSFKTSIQRNTQTGILKIQALNKAQILPYLGYYQAEDPRFDLLAFTDRLMLLKIGIENDTLYFNIMGRKHQLLQFAPLVFMQKGSANPEIAFAINGEGKKVLIINNHYTEQVSGVSAFGWRISIILALLFMLISVPVGLIALICFLFKKVNRLQLQMLILPMVGVLSLGWGVSAFMKVKDDSYLLYQLTSPGSISISIFLGFTLFAICALLNVFMLFKRLTVITNRFMKWTLLLIACSLLLMTYILLTNGWIGLLTWKL